MSVWQEGDALTPTNLNLRGSSAATVAGFSSNTLRAESGNTVAVLAALSTNTLTTQSGNTLTVFPYNVGVIAKSIDSGGAFVNVKAFGAVGNGIVDDTTAIQNAINAVGNAGGGTVYFPSPTSSYLVTRQANGAALTVPFDDVVLQLDPNATIQLQSTATAAYMVFLGDISNVTQHTNLWVFGGKWSASSSTDAKCIVGGWVKNSGCIGAECYGIGASVTGSAGINFAGVSSTTRSSDVIIANNYVHDCGTGGPTTVQDAIITSSIDKVAIYGNRINRTGRAIFMFGAHSDAAVYGNVCRTMSDNGIRVSTVNGGLFSDNEAVAVVGNVVDNAAIDGIRLDGLKCVVANNVVRLSAQRGIKSDLCRNTIFQGNVVSDCSNEGIFLAPAAAVEYTGIYSQNVIIGNSVNSNGGAGIRLQGGGFVGNQLALGNAILNNYCLSNAGGGIECDDTDNTVISGNILEANTNALSGGNKFGINLIHSIASQASHGYQIIGNKAWDLRTSGNRQTGGLAVQVTASGATLNRVMIVDNDFSDCITNGISIPTPTGSLTDVWATNNRLLNNTTPFRDDASLVGTSATAPGAVVSSEMSLGLYRSAASTLALSYGTFQVPSNLTVGGVALYPAGTALAPPIAFQSEQSLGLFRSGTSAVALSYGIFSLNNGFLSSLRTATSITSASFSANQWALSNPAVSGASICININGVMYIWNSSATTIGK